MENIVRARRDAGAGHLAIEWQFLVNKFNQHELGAAARMAQDLDVAIRFAPMRGMEFDPGLQMTWLADEQPGYGAGNVERGRTVYPWPCYFLWRSLVLNSNGKVARCLIYQNVAEYASLHEVSVHEAYNHPSVQRARQLFSRKKVGEGPFPVPYNNCSFYARHHRGENLDKAGSLRVSLPVLGEAGSTKGLAWGWPDFSAWAANSMIGRGGYPRL